ncbi:Predicted thiol-disulfide oxidoreductase YuxK, DCC family [Palleronia salina]|uniref:Predicted thiol-disulfide oxidoreductase YuxK, DCC family n=1 Tax=Palleronia salina TaxID=313368 RepID=A0A1M6F1U4_9RHOB|nr:DUF393 domain-containing protein [Palleronia salina]SHI91688.1 Predicted thiol-disulfide oxidoreductase YuxK, DCC family [Palleronia salina]
MSETPLVIYNGACPICAPEVRSYQRQARAAGADLRFEDLNHMDLRRFDLTEDQAAKRLHVVRDGELISGVDAFLVIWRELPKTHWLARLIDRPVIRPVAGWVYNRVLAPILFAMHKRRQTR